MDFLKRCVGVEEVVVVLVVGRGQRWEVWGKSGEHEKGEGQNILIERPLATYYCNLILIETVCSPQRGSIAGLGNLYT